jgi:hypothetical protein
MTAYPVILSIFGVAVVRYRRTVQFRTLINNMAYEILAVGIYGFNLTTYRNGTSDFTEMFEG